MYNAVPGMLAAKHQEKPQKNAEHKSPQAILFAKLTPVILFLQALVGPAGNCVALFRCCGDGRCFR